MTFRQREEALAILEKSYETINSTKNKNIFISNLNKEEAIHQLDEIFQNNPDGVLSGMIIAVKDNIDVQGFSTTAACPGFSRIPNSDADCVAALRKAGALIIGKTNLDQFATGLVGTRSPYGAVSDSVNDERISGGSSSGSSISVALGIVDSSLGTDTAGSGRIPAGLQGIFGIKPTVGIISNDGVVPACASWDCVTVFARESSVARLVMEVLASTSKRQFPSNLKFSPPKQPRIAIPREFPNMSQSWVSAFHREVDRLISLGFEIKEVDLKESLEVAKMLYESPLVAERAEAVGYFVSTATKDAGLDPTVAKIVLDSEKFSGVSVLKARRLLDRRKEVALEVWEDCTALMVPTAPFHPDISTVNNDPIGVNARMGTFTNFCNLFDLSAIAVPGGSVGDGGAEGSEKPANFGVTFLGRAFEDDVIFSIAEQYSQNKDIAGLNTQGWLVTQARINEVVSSIAVFGAHLHGQPLNYQLREAGAVFAGPVQTTENFRLFVLDTNPPKPGLTGPYKDGGTSITGEEWYLSHSSFARFLNYLPQPMTLGSVSLKSSQSLTGFSFQPAAIESAREISEYGSWIAFLEQQDD